LVSADEFARLADADLAALLHAELSGTIERYEALKQAAGRVDFFDLLLRTRDLVRDTPEVRAGLQHRFSHIFVDEFQDTDPRQAAYLPLARYRGPIPGQPSAVALPVPRPYGGTGLTKTAMNASLPDAVAAFVHWLLTQSGWRVTERDLPGGAATVSARHVCLL